MSVDKTAQRIINAFSNLPPHVGMVFEDGQSIDLVKLVPMAKLWLLRDEIIDKLNIGEGVLDNEGFEEEAEQVFTIVQQIKALEDNDE